MRLATYCTFSPIQSNAAPKALLFFSAASTLTRKSPMPAVKSRIPAPAGAIAPNSRRNADTTAPMICPAMENIANTPENVRFSFAAVSSPTIRPDVKFLNASVAPMRSSGVIASNIELKASPMGLARARRAFQTLASPSSKSSRPPPSTQALRRSFLVSLILSMMGPRLSLTAVNRSVACSKSPMIRSKV